MVTERIFKGLQQWDCCGFFLQTSQGVPDNQGSYVLDARIHAFLQPKVIGFGSFLVQRFKASWSAGTENISNVWVMDHGCGRGNCVAQEMNVLFAFVCIYYIICWMSTLSAAKNINSFFLCVCLCVYMGRSLILPFCLIIAG